MNYETTFVIALLVSRLPIYAYVVYRAFFFRKKLVLISANWLGAVGFIGAIGAITNSFVHSQLYTNIVGIISSLALFMVAFTAKALKPKEG